MIGIVIIGGEVIPRDTIKSIKSECEPIELPGSSWDNVRRFAPGPFIVTTVKLKDGRVLTEVVSNPAHFQPQTQEPPALPRMPSAEGLLRWPPDGYRDGVACTCNSECDDPCCGECGCDACHESYCDFMNSPAYYS